MKHYDGNSFFSTPLFPEELPY